MPGRPQDVAISSHYAYVVTRDPGGLDVLDISSPEKPTPVGHLDMPPAGCITISGRHAYVTGASDSAVFRVIDLKDPRNPRLQGSVQLPKQGNGIAICQDSSHPGFLACVAGGFAGLIFIDVDDPAHPQIVSSIKTSQYDFGVTVAGTIAYVAGEGVFTSVDVRDPLHPRVLDSLGTDYYQYFDVVTEGTYAYAGCGMGLEVIDISDPGQLLRLSDTYTSGWTIAVKGTHALMTTLGGVVAADFSDPLVPRVVGAVSFADYHSGVTGFALSGDYAYVADEEFGLVLVDVSQLDTAERPLDRTIGDLVIDNFLGCLVVPGGIALYDFWDPVKPQFLGSGTIIGSARDVAVRGIYAFLADDDFGLVTFDISDERDPQVVGIADTPGHARGVAISGSYAYVADGGRGLQVIDVSDPAWPAIVASLSIQGHNVYSLALSEGYAYLPATTWGLYVVDIRDPRNPAIVGQLDTTDAKRVAVSGSYAYLADGSGGLAVIDVSNPAIPALVGTSDTGTSLAVVAVDGANASYAFCADADLVYQVDISEPTDPRIVATMHVPDVSTILIRNSDLYLAGPSGLVTVSYTHLRAHETALCMS
ncbi:MAG: hypothetical protein QUU85_19655, partial [Candidatus Eisenbacteria bacterium]|nr:hypothetical protein [Candidatus Eisenbacteria bacterium]